METVCTAGVINVFSFRFFIAFHFEQKTTKETEFVSVEKPAYPAMVQSAIRRDLSLASRGRNRSKLRGSGMETSRAFYAAPNGAWRVGAGFCYKHFAPNGASAPAFNRPTSVLDRS
jgi:hypothetical protein